MSHKLFEPITLRGLAVRNRIWVPPMCQYAVEERNGVATPWHMVHLGGMARGGVGAIIVEATAVNPEGRISPKDLGLWNDDQRDALAPIVDFVHSQGAAIGIQLAHAGRKASLWPEWGEWGTGRAHTSMTEADGGWQTIAPSEVPYEGLALPRETDEGDLSAVVTAFAASARRAVDAGFDFVEVHAAHGYLLHEFLSPLSNLRSDAYGGSLANRMRLLLGVVDAVRDEIGETVPMLVRLSATDWAEGGFTADEAVEVSRQLRKRGVDLVDVSAGGNVPADIVAGPGYQVQFATRIRQEADMPTAAVGLILDPAQAEQILLTGQADVVLIGREMLRDPNFPIRAARELGFDAALVPLPYHRAYR